MTGRKKVIKIDGDQGGVANLETLATCNICYLFNSFRGRLLLD